MGFFWTECESGTHCTRVPLFTLSGAKCQRHTWQWAVIQCSRRPAPAGISQMRGVVHGRVSECANSETFNGCAPLQGSAAEDGVFGIFIALCDITKSQFPELCLWTPTGKEDQGQDSRTVGPDRSWRHKVWSFAQYRVFKNKQIYIFLLFK